jgi:AAA domain
MTTVSLNKSVHLLPEHRDNPFIACTPPPKSTAEAYKALSVKPPFEAADKKFPAHLRVECVRRLGQFFTPLLTHLELESDLGALIRQGYANRNPLKSDYVSRLYDGYERLRTKKFDINQPAVESQASGFALIGCSGIGKTRAVERILSLYPQTAEHNATFRMKQVVWLKIDCPSGGSTKQLCQSFFQSVDEKIGSRYLAQHGEPRASTETMMLQMARIANLHGIGVLVIDEIQHLLAAKGVGRKTLLNFLVTLVNTIGVPVVIVGTLAAAPLLEENFRHARRASGVGSATWDRLQPDDDWDVFLETMWQYQWTREHTDLTSELQDVFYDESQGIIDIAVKLFMLAQMQVIRRGEVRGEIEILTPQLVKEVAKQRLKFVQPMIKALRNNDTNALGKYDDLSPLQQAFDSAANTISESLARQAFKKVVEQERHLEQSSLVTALEAMGVAAEDARQMIDSERKLSPTATDLSVLAAIANSLSSKPPPAKKVAGTPKQNSKILDAVRIGKSKGQNGYEALKEAGVIPSLMEQLAA